MNIVWDMVTGEMEISKPDEAKAERGLPEHGFEMPRLMERIEERAPKRHHPVPSMPEEPIANNKKERIIRH